MLPVTEVLVFVLGAVAARAAPRLWKATANAVRRRLSSSHSSVLCGAPSLDCGCGVSNVRVSAPLDGLDGEEGFLPFSDYAACSLLDLQPSEITMCDLYANLKACAALFLKADREGMRRRLQSGPTGQLLRQHARMASVTNLLCPATPPASAAIVAPGHLCPSSLKASYAVCVEGSLQLLVLELEVLLYRYLAHHWSRIEDMVAVNEEDAALCTTYVAATPSSPPLMPSPPPSLTSIDSISSLDSFHSARLNGQGPSYRTGSRHAPPQAGSRARRNWQKAFRAAVRHNASRRLAIVRRVRSMHEIFKSLQASNHQQEREARQQPVLLLLGGGMAAGKSTVRELIGRSEFWSRVGKDAVVVEADAIKFHDILYQKLSQRAEFSDDQELRAEVHEYSTKAAESLLVAAINAQRDIVFDGTHAWLPFIQQTIAMARDHHHNYAPGPGYHAGPDGNIQERYWEPLPPAEAPACNGRAPSSPLPPSPALPGSPHTPCTGPPRPKQPYRIEIVGVTCDPGLAVVRGIWRRLRMGRGVPVAAQLRSHRLFAENWEAMAALVDSATLYHTGGHLSTFNKAWDSISPKVIAHRSSATQGEMLVNPGAYDQFLACRYINDAADGVRGLYNGRPPLSKCPLRTIPEKNTAGLQGLLAALREAYNKEMALLQQLGLDSPISSDSRPLSPAAPSPPPPSPAPAAATATMSGSPPRSWPASPRGGPSVTDPLKPLADQLHRRVVAAASAILSPRSTASADDVRELVQSLTPQPQAVGSSTWEGIPPKALLTSLRTLQQPAAPPLEGLPADRLAARLLHGHDAQASPASRTTVAAS